MNCPDCGHKFVRDTTCDADDECLVACAGGHVKVIKIAEFEAATAETAPPIPLPADYGLMPEPADEAAACLRFAEYYNKHGD